MNHLNFNRALLCSALCLTSVVALAQPRSVGDDLSTSVGVGQTVKNALQMQASGTHAAPVQPQLHDVGEHVYQRYLKSFDHPIPDTFEENDFSTSGGGSGS